MAGGDVDTQPQAYEAKKLDAAKKRKRPESPARNNASSLPPRPDDAPRPSGRRTANDELPQPFDAKALEPAKKRARSGSPSSAVEGPRKPKRPGQRARITDAEREAIRQRAMDRERQAQEEARRAERAVINDVVRAHYNSVPERGREWRKTASTIKGLRSFNNWIKSCIIQKFAPDEDDSGGGGRGELLVLDIGCGKGGDLGKWHQAPQPVQLYVGLDPAEVSISQARDRYREMTQRGGGGRGGGRGGYRHRGPPQRMFDARFQVKDCFAESISDIPIVREVGFDLNPLSHKGFDVVSMMFCMHYAFETEAKARTMLQNVSGALKKGGRFIGCIPNSDVIGERVRHFNEEQEKKKKKAAAEGGVGVQDGKKKEEAGAPATGAPAGESAEEGEVEEEAEATAEWGNDIYRVRFPGKTPADGTFRPPFGWKYNFYLSEAVDEVPEYVVPWPAFRALAEDYNLELQYHKPFGEIWESEKDDRVLGPLSERMGVRDRETGELLVTPPEMEAAGFYVGFCFYKV